MENKKVTFIKLFDERIANALSAGGFSYTQEQINDGQTVYCFEERDGLMEAIRGFCNEGNYQEIIVVQDTSLFF